MSVEDAVVLLISTEPDKNKSFGSAFIIARDDNYSYLLTCAHVVEQINDKEVVVNKLKIAGLDSLVEIVKHGSSNAIDMTLLKVAGLFDKPLFEQSMLGQEQTDIQVTGYSLFNPKAGQYVRRSIKGKLSNRIKIAADNQEYPFLDISIEDDDFSKLEGGYSGSPLYNSAGQILGVVSHRRTGELGHAFCISNLALLYPEIDKLLPNFNCQISRLSQISTGLLGRMTDIAKIYLKLRKHLNQIEKEGIDDEAGIILQMCESFLNKEIDAIAFNAFCQSLETSTTSAINNQPNYKLLAQRLNKGEICLCLGTDLPKLFDASLRSVQELPERISAITGFENANTYALAEICEYGELHTACTRHNVVSELRQLVTPPSNYQPKIALYELLVKLEKPFLVIATGFDTLLEQRLSSSKQRFVSIVTNVTAESENQRYLLKGFNAQQSDNQIPPFCSDEGLSALRLIEQGYSLIFYPRGYLDEAQDTLLLSERDYFFTAGDVLKKRYPAYLHNKLKSKGLWFLGYQPDSWETRLLAKVLKYQRNSDDRDLPLVIQTNADSFAQLFWQDLRCSLYNNLSINEFVAKIGAVL